MKNSYKYFRVILGVICLMNYSQTAQAQYDPMFTQYMFNEMYINPAYAGSHENIAAAALYRNQWSGLEGAPVTQTFSIHAPISKQKIGIGLNILHEEIGVTHRLALFGNYAYRIKTNKGTFALGLQGGIINLQERFLDIHAAEANDFHFSANTPNLILPNAGFGMYYATEKFYAGISIPRLIDNKIDVSKKDMVKNTADLKSLHYFLMGGYVFTINEGFKLKPSLMTKAVEGSPVEVDCNLNMIVKDVWWIGVGYRTGDALSFMTSFQFTPQLRLGYSFDYTLNSLQDYTNGTHEITLGFDFSFNSKKVITPRLF